MPRAPAGASKTKDARRHTRLTAFERGQVAINQELHRRAVLRARTEGLSWMVWGLVVPMIFLSLEASGLLFTQGPLEPYVRADGSYPAWVVGLWLPWVLAGTLAVRALWFNAVLGVPQLEANRPEVAVLVLGWTLIVGLVWATLALVAPDALDARGILMGVGVAWLATGLIDPFDATPAARWSSALIGAAVLATGLVLLATLPAWPAPGSLWSSWISAAVTGLLPYAAGLYLLLTAGHQAS